MFDLQQWHSYPVTKKLWGEERLLVSCPLYTGKLLVIEPGFACSLHRHPGDAVGPGKDECFFILSGSVNIEWGVDPEFLRIEQKNVGDCLRMHPNTWHRFWCSTPERAVMLEISSEHRDSDVERLQESRAL